MFNLTEDHLYHFTSVKSAMGIIKSGELWFSKIDRLNDINEIRGPEVLIMDNRDKDRLQDLLSHFTQISLTADKDGHYGFDIPAMWGHYAENGRGVCLVFDKHKVLDEVRKRKMYANYVTYSDERDLNDLLYDSDKYGSPDVFIRANRDELFFRKTKDWEYEQEFRLITIDDAPECFSIKDAIQAVVLYGYTRDELISSCRYQMLSSVISSTDIYRYKSDYGHWNLYDMKDNNLRAPITYNMPIAYEE